jgi:hypothetical protein
MVRSLGTPPSVGSLVLKSQMESASAQSASSSWPSRRMFGAVRTRGHGAPPLPCASRAAGKARRTTAARRRGLSIVAT